MFTCHKCDLNIVKHFFRCDHSVGILQGNVANVAGNRKPALFSPNSGLCWHQWIEHDSEKKGRKKKRAGIQLQIFRISPSTIFHQQRISVLFPKNFRPRRSVDRIQGVGGLGLQQIQGSLLQVQALILAPVTTVAPELELLMATLAGDGFNATQMMILRMVYYSGLSHSSLKIIIIVIIDHNRHLRHD